MATNGAAFTSWETNELEYLAFGGVGGYGGSLPGLVTGAYSTLAFIGLSKADPRAGVVYPNFFRGTAVRNAAYEPTSAEWDNYNYVTAPRNATNFEVVDAGGGVMQLRNKVVLAFPVPGAVTGAPVMNYATFMLLGFSGSYVLYLVGAMELGTPYTVTVGTGLEIPVGSFILEKK